mmetsp:Transcript_24995/g.34445  ORF Transcript_24995/g.34445 Transcript_24995/m.34445 type:complete len:122 (+) Transcript_24995:986-1351(+)
MFFSDISRPSVVCFLLVQMVFVNCVHNEDFEDVVDKQILKGLNSLACESMTIEFEKWLATERPSVEATNFMLATVNKKLMIHGCTIMGAAKFYGRHLIPVDDREKHQRSILLPRKVGIYRQ